MIRFAVSYNRALTDYRNGSRYTASRHFNIVYARCAVFQRPIAVVCRIVCIRLEIESKFAVAVVADAVFVRIHLTSFVNRRRRERKRTA